LDSPSSSNTTFVGKLRHYVPSLYCTLSAWERDHLNSFYSSESSVAEVTVKTVALDTSLVVSPPIPETMLVTPISLFDECGPSTTTTDIHNVINLVIPEILSAEGSPFLPSYGEPVAREHSLDKMLSDLVLSYREVTSPFLISTYRVEDWQWLLLKYENQICHWCNRFLSLGGRYVLIKVELEIQPVYWMALAHIPASILNMIHKMVFSYIWLGKKQASTLHLCNWETIAKPKVYGGWGLRNIYCFLRALAAKSLWHGLMHPGIWKRVLKDKYSSHISVSTWLCSSSTVTSFGSQTWKNLLNSLPLIVHWLACKPGVDDSAIVGKDEILGMGKDSILTAELITVLNSKNVFFLFQASCAPKQGSNCSNWFVRTKLGLEGDHTSTWDRYRVRLIGVGISISDRWDELRWTGGDSSGMITKKNVYNALIAKLWKNKI
jgi:hypothetical protein